MKLPQDRTLANVVSLVLCGILAGVVIAAAAFPAVGVSGLTAKSASDSFSDLPAEIKIPPVPQVTTLYASDGKTEIARFFDENRRNVKLADVAPVMRQAIVAAEDNRFYEHQGVDARGIVRAFVRNQSNGQVTQGASTLTQQYVRSILKYGATNDEELRLATEDTAGRKLREMRYAIALEKELTKDQILENYLNITFFGNQGYGIYAASYVYFSKPPSQLTLPEAAMIAGMAQNPTQYNPVDNEQFGKKPALDRREYVLNQMVKLKYITQAEADAAKKTDLGLKPKSAPQSCENGNTAYGFFCGWFLDWWKSNPAFGKTRTEREDNLRKGGYKIVSSLDVRMQKAAQQEIDERLDAGSRFATGIVMVEPGTGRVKAMAINRKYGIKKNPGGKTYPYTVNPLLSGSSISPGYQAGSTFKMFTAIAALEKGIPLSNTIYAQDRYVSQYFGPCKTGGNRYCPKNASPTMKGLQTMSSAFGESANTYFLPLEEQVSVKAAVSAAEKAGVEFRASVDLENKADAQTDSTAWGSFTLGTAQVSPLDMATAYATIAARGKYCAPLPLKSIADQDGKQLTELSTPSCKQTIPQQVADAAADMARCPVGDNSMVGISCTHPGGGRTAASVGRVIDRPVAGKTGTTDDNNAAWFVGFTPNLAAAGFLANPDKYLDSVPNTQIPIDATRQAMNTALQKLPVKQFVAPTSKLAYGIRVTVPDTTGDSVEAATNKLRDAGFEVRLSPVRESSEVGEGRVARTDPSGGSDSTKGSVVTIVVSNGEPPAPRTPEPGGDAGDQIRDQICSANPDLPMCQTEGAQPN
ncbi:penicillin-binding protein [Cryptosporangium aurantiacum]|uniref:Membrane carboxypeptidase (Penicillin-binding protein) n=1 Tax=Cryptosporangium aurantiacum TaxID=134849 RepID=A0A1M7NJ81_9ACTN|nr:transglycosylase domain-containing protein [Cryptosporangium aurantiacum]SHN03855.1 Membrane carboxypeptidase (penicillin-binding protein) [Cryptosporangium aurantiacum]